MGLVKVTSYGWPALVKSNSSVSKMSLTSSVNLNLLVKSLVDPSSARRWPYISKNWLAEGSA